jgi:hypothetical protein
VSVAEPAGSVYRAALTTPGAVVPALFSALGRLPVAMYGLAVLLYVQGMTGSFAAAGLVSAGALVGVATGSVAQGRIVDRLGPTRPLLIVAVLFAGAVATLIGTVEAGAPLPAVIAAAAVVGVVQPALPGASRALWGRLVPTGRLRDAAYNYEAISMEVFFILGPALAALLVAAPWPGTGLLVAGIATVLGTVGFALTGAVRATSPRPADRGLGLLGAFTPGVRTVAVAGLGFGLVVGGVEVGVPAVAADAGSRVLGGVLISAWSVVSVLAGLVYAARPWPRPLHLRLPVLLGGFAVLVAAMAAPGTGSLLALTVVMLVAGALITPQVTAHSLALEIAATPGTATEAFGWVITAITLGVAVGQSVGGWAVEAAGAPAAFLAGGLAGVVLAVVLWMRRGTLAPSASGTAAGCA